MRLMKKNPHGQIVPMECKNNKCDFIRCHECAFISKDELRNMLVKLFKYEETGLDFIDGKDIEKEPVPDKMNHPFSWYCPNCREELSDGGWEPTCNYCENCGQKIKHDCFT